MSPPAVAALRASGWRRDLLETWPGLLLSGVIAVASTFVSDHRGGPTLLYALLLGIALNPIATGGIARQGVDFAARRVLRVGVALLGARITVEQVATLGAFNSALILCGVALTIAAGVVAARLLGLSRRMGILTGGATAICGASAAIAIASVLPQDERSERELLFTVVGVTAFSTLAMIVYPVIAGVSGLAPDQAGIFLGGTIHDVAQVVGAGYSISPQVGDYAVLTKMLRVALLLPVVMIVSLAVRSERRPVGRRADPLLPFFLVVFVALVCAGSFGWIPGPAVAALNDVSRGCLVIAIAAVGLKTSLVEMKKVGGRAIALLGVEGAFLAALVLFAQKAH